MAETKSMRVVPSGKIYRQMFEAQVQLNRSLTKIPREATSLKTSKSGTAIPIVRLSKGEVEHGLLGERQRTWADGFPNDPYVENPVVYKQYAEFVGSQMRELDRTVEGREVRGLPDVVAPAKEQSNIIERIAESRRKRHEASVEEMHQELSVINSEIEPMIAEACETLMKKLEDDGKEITAVLAKFETNEDLLTFSLEGLHTLWEDIQCHSDVRQEWIQELDTWLSNTEEDRMHMIKRVFKDYAKALEKIAHVLLPDLQRFMDKESQLINQTVLSNRRAYGDLFVRLMSSDIEREKTQHILWKRRVDDWKMLKTELAIKRFKHFMQDERVVSPLGAQKVLNYMSKEQEILNDKRLELINQLRDLNPPSSTKTAVYHWNKGVLDITQEIDTTNQLHLASLHKEYESVCQNCLDEIEAIKRELVETGVCSESRANTVVEEFMIPLVGDRQRIYENNLETMEKALEEQNKASSEQLKSLFKFAQGAAHVWDVHEIGLARQERALQEKLEQCRQQHDNQNQDKEAHLDIIMDRMRQDATEKALKDSLTKALEMLEKIRHAYEVFHRDQTGIVKQYPDMVRGELKNYDDALCQLFMVDRNNPLDRQPEEGSDLEQEENEVDEDDVQTQAGKSSHKNQKILQAPKRLRRKAGNVRFSKYSQYSYNRIAKAQEKDVVCQESLSMDKKITSNAPKDEKKMPETSPVNENTTGTGIEDFAVDVNEHQTSESLTDDKPVEAEERSCDRAEIFKNEGRSQTNSTGIDMNGEDRTSTLGSDRDQPSHEYGADLTQCLSGVEAEMFDGATEWPDQAEKLEGKEIEMGMKEDATEIPVDLTELLDEANKQQEHAEEGNDIEIQMKEDGEIPDDSTEEQEAKSVIDAIERESSIIDDSCEDQDGASSIFDADVLMIEDERETSSAENSHTDSILGQTQAGESSHKNQKILQAPKRPRQQAGNVRFSKYSQYSYNRIAKPQEKDVVCQEPLSMDKKITSNAPKDEKEMPETSPVNENTKGTGIEDFAVDVDEHQTPESLKDDKPVEAEEKSCDRAEIFIVEGGSQTNSTGIDMNGEDRTSTLGSDRDQPSHEYGADLTQRLSGVEAEMFDGATEWPDQAEKLEGKEIEMGMKEDATEIPADLTELLDEANKQQEHAEEGNDIEIQMKEDREIPDDFTEEQEAKSVIDAIERESSIRDDSCGDQDGASSIFDADVLMIEEERETSSAKNSHTDSILGSDSKSKKKTPRPTQKKDVAKDMPTAVNEVLSTNKGTIFYVVTVAGEHGIPAEKDGGKDQGKPASTAFMTEVSGLSEDSKPEYLKQIDVPESLLIEIKKIIRMNFLNHLEDWTEQASERAASVVVAKCEELNSELDLRLHLHKPRSRRAEYDVHNVRAAELVMHSERVTRHCKGIQHALTEVRNRFTNMTNEHNALASKFRQEIEALEVVFINATKASRLYGLKNQLNVELDKFMSIIRASLRQFRQHLDETLQMLRESNARFIKSFRVFSDGGNFCPEEIDEYRKRLDKMASNIDKSEGAIMSDLEDMESKRLEQATKVAMEFEDRFKSHMFDLIFMEKIARWLTNTQVKIKAEVAKSNTQAQRLSQHLLDIDRRLDACERPNLDKEQITPEQLNDSLKGVFEAFQNRSEFLNSLKDPLMRPPSGQMQGPPGLGARVGFVQDLGPTPISKAGKQPSEDPSVGVIKTIMKSNKSKLRFGLEADLDGEFTQTGERDKLKSALSTNTSSDRGKVTQSRHGPSPGQTSTNDGTVRKAQSAAASTSSATKTDSWERAPHSDRSRRASKPAKFEKKAVIFGEGMEDEDNCTHFLGIIKSTLKEALEGLLSASEMYYRQKGSRAVTRPQALQETFELCSDVLIQKLQSYYQQADEYHNQCLQEFRSQLTQLEKAVAHVPSLVTSELLKEQISKTETSRTSCEAQFTSTLTALRDRQKEHEQMLRPALGHPHQKDKLEALCQREVERHNDYVEDVEKHTRVLQESAVSHAAEFVEAMARLSENELLQFDNMLVVDDVIKGRVAPTKYPTTELIRRKNAGEPLEDDEDKGALPRGKNVWQGIPNNEMVSGETPAKVQLTASVTTAKTTLGHSAVVKARNQCYQDYKIQFEKTLQQIEDEKQKLMVAEQRWLDSWNTSVEKVKMLY